MNTIKYPTNEEVKDAVEIIKRNGICKGGLCELCIVTKLRGGEIAGCNSDLAKKICKQWLASPSSDDFKPIIDCYESSENINDFEATNTSYSSFEDSMEFHQSFGG